VKPALSGTFWNDPTAPLSERYRPFAGACGLPLKFGNCPARQPTAVVAELVLRLHCDVGHHVREEAVRLARVARAVARRQVHVLEAATRVVGAEEALAGGEVDHIRVVRVDRHAE
jgi:hypothetical protein